MKRIYVLAASVVLGLGALVPPVAADDFGAPPQAGGSAQSGFFGFQQLTTVAQGQVATGYFFAIGDEVNRLVGARSEIDGPPVNARTVAAFLQRGVGATYVYGVAGGPGGTSGALPDPPPGEAPGYYPTVPHESTFQGPVTAVLNGGEARTVDGRFHSQAKEKDGAAGLADAAVTNFDVPGYFAIEQAHVTSRGEPIETGVEAESISILRGITLGPLHINTLTSRAYGFVPSAPGDPKGEATTIVEGAAVGKTPVMITNRGVIVADKTDPSAEQQVRAALAQAGLSDVRLLDSLAAPSENNQQVNANAGGLGIIHNDPKFGASNPQGFRGGGFSLGGAEVTVTGRPCESACSSPSGGSETPGVSFAPPTPAEARENSSGASAPSLAPELTDPPADADVASFDAARGPDGSDLASPSGVASDSTTTFTSDVTPGPSPAIPEQRLVPPRRTAGSSAPRARAVFAAVNAMGRGQGDDDLRRLFLALAGALTILVVACGVTNPLILRRKRQ